ncbi:MAG: SUF system Fe-S cluster assembly protein [Pseudomonadota bacterium]
MSERSEQKVERADDLALEQEGQGERYVDAFLKAGENAQPAAPEEPPQETIDDRILAALREIYDPEIPVNIYDLGLIYDCGIDTDNNVEIIMTLTTPHCPVAETMPGEVESRVAAVPGVQSATVTLVWDPPWDPSRMTEEAKLELGFL